MCLADLCRFAIQVQTIKFEAVHKELEENCRNAAKLRTSWNKGRNLLVERLGWNMYVRGWHKLTTGRRDK